MIKIQKNSAKDMLHPLETDLCILFYKKVLILQAYGQLKNIKVIHIANEQMNNKAYTLKLMRMGMVPGAPDYLICIKGQKGAFMEFKRNSKCKQTVNQRKFENSIKGLGFPYYLVWDVDKALEILYQLDTPCERTEPIG